MTAVRLAPPRPQETTVLMADPAHFDVQYVINPHMAAHVGAVDRGLARKQWQALADQYGELGFTVEVLDPAPGLPDLVFTANQSLPVLREDGSVFAVRSRMHAPERGPEVDLVARWYAARGIDTVPLDPEGSLGFEGMGDALWVPGRRVLMLGHGFRSELAVAAPLAKLTGAVVLALELVDARFYHLDTCLAPLSDRVALWVPSAFSGASRDLLLAAWETLIPVDDREASELLACNGHCPDGRHFLVQRGATDTIARVKAQGLVPIELDTSEFLKSGGSVFCLKLMLP